MATPKTTNLCKNCGHNHPEPVTRCGACGAPAGHDPTPKPATVAPKASKPKATKPASKSAPKPSVKPTPKPATVESPA